MKKRLGDIADVISGFAFKSSWLGEHGVPVIKIGNILDDGSIDLEKCQYLPDSFWDSKFSKYLLRPGDILIAMTGATCGKVGRFNSEEKYLLNQRVAVVRGREVSQDMLWVVLSQKIYREKLYNLGRGAAQPNISGKQIEDIEVLFPDKDAIPEIEQTISDIDDLIEKNKQQIALLEESAQLIYKEWFVRLRFPGYEKVRILNGVPEGWKYRSLSEFIDVTHGYAFKGEFFVDEATKFVLTTPGNIKVGAGFKSDKFKYYSSEGPVDERYVFQSRDIFVGMTDLSKTSDTLGYPAFVPYSEDEVYLHNQRLGRVIPKTDYFPRNFIFQILTDFRYRHHVVGAATGTSVKHTSPTRILSYSQFLPPISKKSLIGKFDDLVEPIYLQILNLELQNKKLALARGLLLPRLMNGDIEL